LVQDPEERHNVINKPDYASRLADMKQQLDLAKQRYNFTQPKSI